MPKKSEVDNFYFRNRDDASRQLLETFPVETFQNRDCVVIGLSRGGILLADALAKAINASTDTLFIESIVAPNNPDLPIAMISETQEIVIHRPFTDSFAIEDDYVYSEAGRIYDEKILSNLYQYRKGKALQSVKEKVTIIVDECIETGLTISVALKSLIGLGVKNVYIATPIMDESVYDALQQISDGVFCPHRIDNYISVEYYYAQLDVPTSDLIEKILESHERNNTNN